VARPKNYSLGCVRGVRLYNSDVVVVREGNAPAVRDRVRSEITEFSRKSRMRLAFVASNTDVTFRSMITLTYPREYPTDGASVKKHLHTFLVWLRRDLGALEYLWFLEFQARGAPHVHILINRSVPRSRDAKRSLQFRVSASWYRFVGSGDEKHLRAGTRVERLRQVDGGRRYAIKYAHKMYQKRVPPDYWNVGRFWGCSRGVKPDEPALVECSEDDIRGVLEGWEHAPHSARTLYRVLYNQSDRFRAHIAAQFDK